MHSESWLRQKSQARHGSILLEAASKRMTLWPAASAPAENSSASSIEVPLRCGLPVMTSIFMMRRIDVQRKDSVSSGYLRTFRNSFSSAVPCRRRTSGTVHGSDDRSENRSGRHRNALPGAGVKIVAFWGRYGCFTTKERQFFVLLKMLLGGSAVVADGCPPDAERPR